MGWRIHFTAEDLAKTRIIPHLGPLAETMFGFSLVRSQAPPAHAFAGWRQRVRGRLTPEMKPLAALIPPGRVNVDLWTLTGSAPTIEQGLRNLVAVPPEHARAELEFTSSDSSVPKAAWAIAETSDRGRHALADAALASYRALLEPYWSTVQSHLDAERLWRSRMLLEGGVELLLTSLSPLIRWNSPVLEVQLPRDFEVRLDGRGIDLVPSLFVGERPVLLTDLANPAAPPKLIFPATHDPVLLTETPRPHGSLASLMGRTRAAALARIAGGCNTTELAEHLGVSVAAASQHATVLRANGLIMTRRHGGAVLHTITTLGAQLLKVDA